MQPQGYALGRAAGPRKRGRVAVAAAVAGRAKTSLRAGFAVCAALVLAALTATVALAQQPAASGPAGPSGPGPGPAPASAEVQRQYDAAFAAMLASPGNLDRIFRFAELAVAVGDLEGAVSALERMLLIDPNLPRVRLELGVLYFRLGSYEAARTYLLSALAAQNLPEDVRARAQTFLAEIDKQRSPSKLSGTLLAGIRYQSNANAAPTGNVRVGGIPASLDDNSTAAADWNAFAALNVLHLYDMGTQWGDMLETRVAGYVARQFERDEVDVSLVSFNSGPRLVLLPRQIQGLTLRPSIAVDYVALDDRTDYMAHGVSLSLDKRLGMGSIGLGLDWRQREYNDTKTNAFNSDRDGRELSGRVSWDFVLTSWLTGAASVGYADYDARREWESYGEFQFGLTLNVYSDFSPFVKQQQSALVLSASHLRSRYEDPDPAVDPKVRRKDRDWRVSLTGSLPLTEDISLVVQGGYARRDSSLPNYEYDNWFGMGGLAWRF